MTCSIVNAHCPFDYALFGGAVCVMGVFDGVHLGHRYLIDQAIQDAKENDSRCVIVTFSVDPDELFNKQGLHKLETNAQRLNKLATLGADSVAVLPFDEEFASQNPMHFLQRIFRKFPPKSIHVGKDFRFGANAEGDVGLLQEWGNGKGVRIVPHELLQVDGEAVSATRIRHLLEQGNNTQANKLLGVTIGKLSTV